MNTSQGTAADWLLGTFKKHPEGFLLLAAGAVLMMRQSGGIAQAVASAMPSGVAATATEARDTVAGVADRTMRQASDMASTASDYAKQATRSVGEQSDRAMQQAQSTMQQAQSTLQQTFNRVLREQPLAIAVAGIAAGAALASAFPTSDFEKETLGPIGDQVSEAAQRVGGQIKDATATAGQTLMNAADQRGLNVDGLKEVATEVAGAFTGSMGGNSQDKKPDAFAGGMGGNSQAKKPDAFTGSVGGNSQDKKPDAFANTMGGGGHAQGRKPGTPG